VFSIAAYSPPEDILSIFGISRIFLSDEKDDNLTNVAY